MTVATMRRIDRYIGVPLCWIAGFIMRTQRVSPISAAPQKILVIKFFGLGSVLLTTSVLAHMRREQPDLHIAYLTFARNAEILRRCTAVDAILLIDQRSPLAFIQDTLRIILGIRRHSFDAVIDFEFFSKFSTLLGALSGARIRGGFALPTRWRRSILTHSVPIEKRHHVVYSFAALASIVCGTTHGTAPVALETTADERKTVLDRFGKNSNGRIVINVNAGSTFLERRWPPVRFTHLVDRLTPLNGASFIFIGSAEERSYVQSIIDRTEQPGRCINTAGLLSIGELSALLRESHCFIGNDSGPMHIAAAAGIPIIGLFGPESPAFYGPLSEQAHVVYKNISCSPCMNVYDAKQFACPYAARCMEQITVEDVVNAAVGTGVLS